MTDHTGRTAENYNPVRDIFQDQRSRTNQTFRANVNSFNDSTANRNGRSLA